MHSSTRTLAKLAGAAAIACLTASTSLASSKSYMYAACPGGEIHLHPDGSLMSISGKAICTRNCREFDNFLETIGGIGMEMNAAVPVNSSFAPDTAYFADDSGSVISIYGVPMKLVRDASRDGEVAGIAGNPANAIFFAYKTAPLGPEDPNNVLPLSSNLHLVFAWSQAGAGPRLSDLAADPILVVSDTVGEQGGSTTPAAWSIPVCSTLSAAQFLRDSTTGNNAPLFFSDRSGGPVIGGTWSPRVRPNSQDPAATDMLLVSAVKTDRPVGGGGSLLVDAPYAYTAVVSHGDAFAMPIPNDCALVGTLWTSQALTSENDSSSMRFYNAIDLIVGAQ